MNRIGFMQGRLVDQVDGKIQAFPRTEWRLEFPRAAALGIGLMEWTLDDEGIEDNPFITAEGQAEIRALVATHGLRIASLTGDCFMQAPFWKCAPEQRPELLHKLDLIIRAAAALSVRYLVVPLVDNGRLENTEQKQLLIEQLLLRVDILVANQLQIIFETDYSPEDYRQFLSELPATAFNVNYDIGNSASLGFDPAEEFAAYGHRIVNVHVKDRLFGGTTVPLGTGSADFERVFAGLAKLDYRGNYILQTARATNGHHAEVLARYAAMTLQWRERRHES